MSQNDQMAGLIISPAFLLRPTGRQKQGVIEMADQVTTTITADVTPAIEPTADATGDKPKGGNGLTPEQEALINKHVDSFIGDRLNRAKKQWEADQADVKSKADKEAEEKRLLEEKQFETVISTQKAKLAELEPQLTTTAARLADYQQTVDEILTAKLERLGDQAKGAVDNLPGEPDTLAKLRWLNANENLFKTDDKKPLGSPQSNRQFGRLPQPAPAQQDSAQQRPIINF